MKVSGGLSCVKILLISIRWPLTETKRVFRKMIEQFVKYGALHYPYETTTQFSNLLGEGKCSDPKRWFRDNNCKLMMYTNVERLS